MLQVQTELNQMPPFSNLQEIPETCAISFQELVARTAELLERIDREYRCRFENGSLSDCSRSSGQPFSAGA
jgi:hypothetical protein